jgi:lysosomal acid lipase/cholesteryl ester hydrolase
MFAFVGFSAAQTNLTLLPVVLNHSPSGASAKQFVQYGQQYASGKFSQFDHGKEDNMHVYGQPNPPQYDIKNVKVPVSTYYGRNDWFTGQEVCSFVLRQGQFSK